MGHARRYQEDQSELTVRCLLYGVDAVVLHRGGGSVSPGRRLVLRCKSPRTDVSQGAVSSYG